MTTLILVRYLHFIAVLAIVSAIITQQFLVAKSMTRRQIKRTATVDGIYGLGTIMVLIAGFSLWFWIGKPSEFYSTNWVFHTKLFLFIILGLLSIYPSVFFSKNKKGGKMSDEIVVPPIVITLLRLELVIIVIMPLLASVMAQGIGAF